ncbi:methylmalonyl Co-A mutase-associated GTPase MeaB [Magnetospirillum sp. 15-1]|uniref:methylmalonyl Co-A mutase-associated GTPase MeaB n=1 Tax=Magnetospirillum sp. 15-1 TaxID=1979370 RepID=UPI0018D56D01|nr:methylmalonyl Co-A mutase-associated GTPase MeaB [Magnetospirillum sp. 15-1]
MAATPKISDDTDEVAQALASGDIRTCARLITRIERGDTQLVPLLQRLYRMGGQGRTVGITGPPGAGKSTLVNQLVKVWRRRGLSVAVLAVDPSSPFSGGAVLGDRFRMVEHGCDEGVFIRSMASRGQLGGLAKAAGDALTALCAMPWDIVLIETVGVGQNETDIMRHAEVVVLLQTPMGGDDMQAAKAGVLEIADIFVVNKSDHPQADQTVRQLSEMVTLGQCLHPDRSWVPPVMKVQANCGDGVVDLVDQIERRFAHLTANPEIAKRFQGERLKHRVGEILQDMLRQRMRSNDDGWLNGMIAPVVARQSDPYELAASLLARI